MMRLSWRITVRAIGCIAALITLGYASNWISAGACEQRAAHSFATDPPVRDVFILADAEYPGSETILRRAGFRTTQCQATRENFDCFPWAGVARAQWVAPYVVSVKWGYVLAPLAGHGGHTWFLCLFGLVFELPAGGGWAT